MKIINLTVIMCVYDHSYDNINIILVSNRSCIDCK